MTELQSDRSSRQRRLPCRNYRIALMALLSLLTFSSLILANISTSRIWKVMLESQLLPLVNETSVPRGADGSIASSTPDVAAGGADDQRSNEASGKISNEAFGMISNEASSQTSAATSNESQNEMRGTESQKSLPLGSWETFRCNGNGASKANNENTSFREVDPSIDVLSIGSLTRRDYHEAQKHTWASHVRVRNFFDANERTADRHSDAFGEKTNPTRSSPGNSNSISRCVDSLSDKDSLIRHVQQCRSHNIDHVSNAIPYSQSIYSTLDANHSSSSLEIPSEYFMQREMRYIFFNRRWLLKKRYPAGWACAQRRVGYAVGLLGRLYLREINKRMAEKQTLGDLDMDAHAYDISILRQVLPHYLLVVDDDSYYNIDSLLQYMSTFEGPSHGEHYHHRDFTSFSSHHLQPQPRAHVGCLVRIPVQKPMGHWQPSNFTSPQGGMGTVFNRASLVQLMLVRHVCTKEHDTNHAGNQDNNARGNHEHDHVCQQLKANMINEQSSFRYAPTSFLIENNTTMNSLQTKSITNNTTNSLTSSPSTEAEGMTISDFMFAYSSRHPHCLHSDWTMGFFVNYYLRPEHIFRIIPSRHLVDNHNISYKSNQNFNKSQYVNEWAKYIPEARMYPYGHDSIAYKASDGQCPNNAEKCSHKSDVCHYVTPAMMKNVSQALFDSHHDNDGRYSENNIEARFRHHPKDLILSNNKTDVNGTHAINR